MANLVSYLMQDMERLNRWAVLAEIDPDILIQDHDEAFGAWFLAMVAVSGRDGWVESAAAATSMSDQVSLYDLAKRIIEDEIDEPVHALHALGLTHDVPGPIVEINGMPLTMHQLAQRMLRGHAAKLLIALGDSEEDRALVKQWDKAQDQAENAPDSRRPS